MNYTQKSTINIHNKISNKTSSSSYTPALAGRNSTGISSKGFTDNKTIKKKSYLQEAKELFEDYTQTKNHQSFSKAEKIITELCFSGLYPTTEKYELFLLILKYAEDIAYDILSRWRDSMKYVKNRELDDLAQLLSKIIKCNTVSSHERLYTAVFFYNIGLLNICYELFSFLAFDESIDVKRRLEAIKFLYAADDDEELTIAQDCLIDIISNRTFPCDLRYSAIADYISKKGITTTINTQKIRVPYKEDFVFSLQFPFFLDEENEPRYRILSGQHLLQMSDNILSEKEKNEIVTVLFKIAKNVENSENLRADAADVVLRLGNSKQRAEARSVVVNLGMTADGNKNKTLLPRTIYDDSQNVHNEDIDKQVQDFISKMMENPLGKDNTYSNVRDNISNTLKSKFEGYYPAKIKYNINRALHRVGLDTAVFTEYKATLAEILIHVWTYIHSSKFDEDVITNLEQRMFDELSDMSDTCSSGHASRFVNVLSTVDDTFRIGWLEQIQANVKGRMQARIRDCEDNNIQAGIALGMMEDSDEEYRNIYLKFIKKGLNEIKEELYKEFVGGGYINNTEFTLYYNSVLNDWGVSKDSLENTDEVVEL